MWKPCTWGQNVIKLLAGAPKHIGQSYCVWEDMGLNQGTCCQFRLKGKTGLMHLHMGCKACDSCLYEQTMRCLSETYTLSVIHQ
jgi:hypothetical protein